MQLNLNELCELIAALNQTDISELTLKSTDFELTLRKGMPLAEQPLQLSDSALAGERGSASAGLNSTPTLPTAASSPELEAARAAANAKAAASVPVPLTAPSAPDKRWVEIISPMVGTFYRSPAPDEPAFVDVGDRIRSGQTVCIIEAMKLMNELEAEVSGEIVEILAQNGDPVEYGQPLMRVNPG